MKQIPQKNRRADLLKLFAQGEIALQDLKATLLGINLNSEIHFALRGYENRGCIDGIQIDEIYIPGGSRVLVPCEDAHFYEPQGGIILVLGTNPPDDEKILRQYERKVSGHALFAVGKNLGTRGLKDFDHDEEESLLLERIKERRNELQILKSNNQ